MEGPQSVKEKGICEHLVQGQSQNTMLPLEEQSTRIRVKRLPEGWYLHEELIRFFNKGQASVMAMVSSRFRRRELILQPPAIWLNKGQVVGGKGIVERDG